VPVITGVADDSLLQNDLLDFVNTISNDEFLASLFQQIDVQSDGELVLVPRVGNHLILFGTIENMDNKFRNLRAVYKKGLNNGKWNRYKSITLKYENQVVCTLK
jgi:cell division protein FtsQ